MTVRIATAQYPIEALADLDAWRDKQAQWVARAAKDGAELLVFPEYAALELTRILTPDEQATLPAQLDAVQRLWPSVIDTYTQLARKHGVWLLGGTTLERVHRVGEQSEYRNRARLYAPSGQLAVQEKLQMTRFESEHWGIHPGNGSVLCDTPLGKLGIVICYDIEFPLIARRLVEAGADLLLVPSCTDTLAGHNRVSLSCRARALESQCFVVHSVTVGDAHWSLALDENHGAAAVVAPVDLGFPSDGVLAQGVLDAPCWVHAELDLQALAYVRGHGQVYNHRDWSSANHLQGSVTTERLVSAT